MGKKITEGIFEQGKFPSDYHEGKISKADRLRENLLLKRAGYGYDYYKIAQIKVIILCPCHNSTLIYTVRLGLKSLIIPAVSLVPILCGQRHK